MNVFKNSAAVVSEISKRIALVIKQAKNYMDFLCVFPDL